MSLRGSTVMVTGATGFIGGRLVEQLVLGEGATVRALVSSYSRCARIARFPVDLIRGDLLDQESVSEAAKGCDVIFHCAFGARGSREERRRATVEGTEKVLAAAAASGARVVHMSSQMVYGLRESGYIDETTPRQRSGSTYADSKLEAEEKVMTAATQGQPVTVLQPTAVYGPHAPVWTVDVLQRMRAGGVPLIDGGEGICNAVYIDDVVSAALLAASSEAALGECFLISAAEPVTWREFYSRFEAMLGVPATVPVSSSATAKPARPPTLLRELPAMLREETVVRDRLRRTAEVRFLIKLLRPLRSLRGGSQRRSATPELDRLRRLRTVEEPQVHPVAASEAAFFGARSRVQIDKARQRLGYRPQFSLDAGMEVTAAWARWAGLVPEGVGNQETLVAGTH